MEEVFTAFNRRRNGTEGARRREGDSQSRGSGLIIGERRGAGPEGNILHLLLSEDRDVVADDVGHE